MAQHPMGWFLLWGGRLAFAAGCLVLLTAPLLFGSGQIKVLTEFLSLLVLAVMWNLLAGYADILTIGQQAFVGTGAYAFYGFAALAGLDPFLAVALAGVVALIAALPMTAIVFRLRAAYLAVGTWVVAQVFLVVAGKLPHFGGGPGVSLPVSLVKAFGANPGARYQTIYLMTLALALVAFFGTALLLRSSTGLGLTAMRDNEEGAAAVGVNVFRGRMLCFLWTAPFLGIDGALITLQKLRIAPTASFSIADWTVLVIFIVVIGGIGSIEGPVLGTILFFVLREYLSSLGTWHMIVLGALSILVILVEPRGLWGAVRRFLPTDLIPVSHGPTPEFASRAASAKVKSMVGESSG